QRLRAPAHRRTQLVLRAPPAQGGRIVTVATSTRTPAVAGRRRPRSRRRIRTSRILLGALGIALALIWVFPVYWMMNSALLPNVILQNTTPTWLPFGGSW